jgi:hypothetical protein
MMLSPKVMNTFSKVTSSEHLFESYKFRDFTRSVQSRNCVAGLTLCVNLFFPKTKKSSQTLIAKISEGTVFLFLNFSAGTFFPVNPWFRETAHYPRIETRVAGWYIFKPKIPIWVNFGGFCNAICMYILWSLGIFLAIWYTYFMAVWYVC